MAIRILNRTERVNFLKNSAICQWKTSSECCFRMVQCRHRFGSPKLTPQQVSTILRANEKHANFQAPSSIRAFDTNFLPSNNPIEDRHAEARCLQTTGLLFGVFDGHGGPACAEVLSRRLFLYIAASLLPLEMLKELESVLRTGNEDTRLLDWHHPRSDATEFSLELSRLYRRSLWGFVSKLILRGTTTPEFQMKDNLTEVFSHLDRDLWEECEGAESAALFGQTLAVATSGAVACVAHVDGAHLHVASTGDCAAVIGTLSESNTWVAKRVTRDHAFDNEDEVRRVLSEHPKNEAETVLKQERLLGELAPLRAFGDFRYKWPSALQKRLLVPVYGHRALPANYYTPPYLTARPEVFHHRLLPRDRFLVLASDGLWEQLAPSRVVQLVGEYMRGRQTLEPFRLLSGGRQQQQPAALTLGKICEVLAHRKEGLDHKPVDSNAATHLIRSALGGTEYGVDHAMLSQMLSMPQDVVRMMRDDISIVIVFFDSDFLRRCPA